jgi:formate hydrogenlyase transcriptional activator
MQRLVHELEVHQIELEMQNEELHRAQEEIESSRDKYAELYDFAPVGYFTFDTRGLIREVNFAGARLLGIERSMLVDRLFSGFIADADCREVFFRHLEHVVQRQDIQRCEIRLTGKDCTEIHGQLQSVTVGVIESKDRYILCSIVDGTAAKQLETELQDARNYAESIVETVRKPLVVLNSDLKVLTANQSYYCTFKATPEETIGNFIYDLGNRQWDLPELRVLFEKVLHHDTVFKSFEVEHDFIDIGRKIILLNAREIFREQIGSHIILLAMDDITERRQLEAELQNAHDKLEITVHERTKELTVQTRELTKANVRLTQEIEERKKAEKSLQGTYAEINQLKDRLQAENIYLEQEVAREHNFGEIIGQSDVLSHVFSLVEQVAPMNATVLLLGETGTGKGVIARAIHNNGARKDRPLITVNCTTLPAALIESELFGRERGAFTGSDSRQLGRFELADGGTIFLDEIGELPLELQGKLLRVIQDGEYERLGGGRTIKTNVRIIAATNRNLEEEIKNGRFREDLYYRLNVFPITMPPLRQRKEDIPLLVNHFVAKFNKKIGKRIETVSKDTMSALQEYHWPGNVRELESVIERSLIISQGSTLHVLDRLDTIRTSGEPTGQDVKTLVKMEQDLILQSLQKTGWRINGKDGAAGQLGINPSTLRARMRKYCITRQQLNTI